MSYGLEDIAEFRIEEKNGFFFPQEKGWLWGWNYFKYLTSPHGSWRTIKFNTLTEASNYIQNVKK